MLLKLVRSTPLYAWAFNLRAWTLTGVSCSLDDALLWNDSQQALNRFFLQALDLHSKLLTMWRVQALILWVPNHGLSIKQSLPCHELSFILHRSPPPLICHFEQDLFTLAQSVGELSKELVSFPIVPTLDESLFKSQVPSSRKSQVWEGPNNK